MIVDFKRAFRSRVTRSISCIIIDAAYRVATVHKKIKQKQLRTPNRNAASIHSIGLAEPVKSRSAHWGEKRETRATPIHEIDVLLRPVTNSGEIHWLRHASFLKSLM